MSFEPFFAVVGAGNVGKVIARSLNASGHTAVPWSSRAPLPTGKKPTAVFLCVPEAALAALDLSAPYRYVIVSGSLDPRAVKAKDVSTFHPLMGFSAHGPKSLKGVPIGVDSDRLALLAKRMDAVPFRLPADRTLYHAACVLGGAGVLAAWTEACTLLSAAGVKSPQDVLLPIATAALDRQQLTGPVPRGDEATIDAHRKAIKAKAPDTLAIYDALIAAMRRMQGKKP